MTAEEIMEQIIAGIAEKGWNDKRAAHLTPVSVFELRCWKEGLVTPGLRTVINALDKLGYELKVVKKEGEADVLCGSEAEDRREEAGVCAEHGGDDDADREDR